MVYTLDSLPDGAQKVLLQSYHLAEQHEYQQKIRAEKSGESGGLLVGSAGTHIEDSEIIVDRVIFATDHYEDHDYDFNDSISRDALNHGFFKPRVEKSKEIQKERTKSKAEVFTPSWVANLQNNLVDGAILGYEGAFNVADPKDTKKWIGTKKKIKFNRSENPDYSWHRYVTERRLEITAGEGPYLFSRYDTTTGEYIPVRTSGKWMRIGILDRKLRVLSENVDDRKVWTKAAMFALGSTYGYEWQGDNLMLARLNFVNTFVDYYTDLWDREPSEKMVVEVAKIASWNLWQMDGLKMVVPETCSDSCMACSKKLRAGHNGKLSVIRLGGYKTFEELGPIEWFSGVKVQPKKDPGHLGLEKPRSKHSSGEIEGMALLSLD